MSIVPNTTLKMAFTIRANAISPRDVIHTLKLENILKNKPADFDIDRIPIGIEGHTPLSYAVWTSNVELAELLILHGANTQYTDDDRNTYLHMAVMKECVELIKLFCTRISWNKKNIKYISSLDIVYYALGDYHR